MYGYMNNFLIKEKFFLVERQLNNANYEGEKRIKDNIVYSLLHKLSVYIYTSRREIWPLIEIFQNEQHIILFFFVFRVKSDGKWENKKMRFLCFLLSSHSESRPINIKIQY